MSRRTFSIVTGMLSVRCAVERWVLSDLRFAPQYGQSSSSQKIMLRSVLFGSVLV